MKKLNNLVFLYDKLCTKEWQEKMGLNLTFISLGKFPGKMRRIPNIRMWKKRFEEDPFDYYAFLKSSSTKCIYGGIFFSKRWETDKYKIAAWCSSAQYIIGKNDRDTRTVSPVEVYPIECTKPAMQQIVDNEYLFNPLFTLSCMTILGKPSVLTDFFNKNDDDKTNTNKQHMNKTKAFRVCKEPFKQMCKENGIEVENL